MSRVEFRGQYLCLLMFAESIANLNSYTYMLFCK